MALFFECMQECAQKVLDAADIVRDGDLSTAYILATECRFDAAPLAAMR
jgi:hypothetical protein